MSSSPLPTVTTTTASELSVSGSPAKNANMSILCVRSMCGGEEEGLEKGCFLHIFWGSIENWVLQKRWEKMHH